MFLLVFRSWLCSLLCCSTLVPCASQQAGCMHQTSPDHSTTALAFTGAHHLTQQLAHAMESRARAVQLTCQVGGCGNNGCAHSLPLSLLRSACWLLLLASFISGASCTSAFSRHFAHLHGVQHHCNSPHCVPVPETSISLHAMQGEKHQRHLLAASSQGLS